VKFYSSDTRGHYLPDDNVKTAVEMWFCQRGGQFCRDGLMNPPERWRKSADRGDGLC